jgi:hypothetical protein
MTRTDVGFYLGPVNVCYTSVCGSYMSDDINILFGTTPEQLRRTC